jgi:bacterioferritin-associated ferredoxin
MIVANPNLALSLNPSSTSTQSAPSSSCQGCPTKLVCRCLQVTEETLLRALEIFELQTVKDIRCKTGAGDGCTACHRKLRQYLEGHKARLAELPLAHASSASSPI